jgi:hypothetical protein
MAAGDRDFCDGYHPDDAAIRRDIDERTDGFFRRYKRWIDAARSSNESLCWFFEWEIVKARLDRAHVLKRDCVRLNQFVIDNLSDRPVCDAVYSLTDEEFAEDGGALAASPARDVRFRRTLRKYFEGNGLNDKARRILNGTLSVRVDPNPPIARQVRRSAEGTDRLSRARHERSGETYSLRGACRSGRPAKADRLSSLRRPPDHAV